MNVSLNLTESIAMNNKRITVLLITALVCCISVVAYGDTQNKVGRLSEDEFESLMKGTNGRYLIVAMAAWCKPCRKELPILDRLYKKYKDRGLRVVGISLDDSGPKAMQPIVDRLKVTFPVYWVSEDAIDDYDIYAVPLLFFIRDGEQVVKVVGQRSEKVLQEKIESFLED